ncbi:MAG: CopG family transcriptional regulator [Desulfurococcales archaeon ex4484_217_2]|nr:MAG: CopG family transcriptional regulator [Desulfurococcales archaeon ex4484_217_2]
MGRVVVVSVKMPKELLRELDKLVEEGLFSSRSEAIRRGIALLIRNYYKFKVKNK